MTISNQTNKKEFLIGNVYSIEQAEIVLLLEDHDSTKDFEKVKSVIDTYYRDSRDLILLEHPQGSCYERLIDQERKLGTWRVEVLENKNLAGWDHKLCEKWVTEYYQNPDVKDFTQAVSVLENIAESDNIEDVNLSFKTLIRGLRYLEGDPTLLPPSKYESLINRKDYQSRKFATLKNKLIEIGKEVLIGLKEVFIKQTFPLRQEALVESIKEHAPNIKAKTGRIFVIMGENHGNPFTSVYPAEVQKVINFLANHHLFVSY